MTLTQINALSRVEFVQELGWIFEDSPWVADRAWTYRPFTSLEELHGVMTAALETAGQDKQLDLLRAHPELGSCRPMSDASVGEQAAVFSQGPPPREDKLRRYRERFGFPFIFAVKGASAEDIEYALLVRLEGSPEDELPQALSEVRRIAWFRLHDKYKES